MVFYFVSFVEIIKKYKNYIMYYSFEGKNSIFRSLFWKVC